MRKKPSIKLRFPIMTKKQTNLNQTIVSILLQEKTKDLQENKSDPTHQEISQCLTQIQKKYKKNTGQIVNKLYFLLNQYEPIEAVSVPIISQRKQSLIKKSAIENKAQNDMPQKSRLRIINKPLTLPECLERKIAIETFIQSGFDFQQAKFSIEMNKSPIRMSEQSYEKVTKEVVIKAFQLLQKYLIEQSKDKKESIKPMSEQQIRSFCKSLIKIKQFLNEEEVSTFLYFLSCVQPPKDITIHKNQAINLYRSIQAEFRKVILSKPFNKSETKSKSPQQQGQPDDIQQHSEDIDIQDNKSCVLSTTNAESKRQNVTEFSESRLPQDIDFRYLIEEEDQKEDLTLLKMEIGQSYIAHADVNGAVQWTKQMDSHLLYFYFQTRIINKARDKFIVAYRNDERFANIQICRRRFYKIMREAVRKLQKWHSQQLKEVSRSLELDEEKIKLLISAPEALSVRKYIAEIYIRDDVNIPLLNKAILQVNRFLKEKVKRRFHQKNSKLVKF